MNYSSRRSGDSESKVIDSLRITDAQWHALLDRLDQPGEQSVEKASGRRHERVSYRNMTFMLVSVQQDLKSKQKFLVRTHNISASGLAYLHGNYIHVGSRVELLMLHQSRGMTRIPATVRRCEHLSARIHHVGVEFDHPLDDLDGYLNAKLTQADLDTLA